MRFRINCLKSVTAIVLAALFLCGASSINAQETPLSFTQLIIALQATSGGISMAQKNSFVTQRVKERGVSFTLTEQLESELSRAGATAALIAAIRENGPRSNQTSTTISASKTPEVKFTRLWVEQDFSRDGRIGMLVHTEFTAYNLNEIPLQLTLVFKDSSDTTLKTANINYSNKRGELALYKNFIPGFDAADYDDSSIFVPYDEMQLDPGTHRLKIVADITYADGRLLKHLTQYELTVSKARPAATAPRAKFDKMWVDYGVTEGGQVGMRIHVKIKIYNLKDIPCWLTIMFEKGNGERLVTENTLYADRNGGVTLIYELMPGYPTSVYNDVAVFMPYKEFNLGKGEHNLKMRADLTYPDGGLIEHLNNYTFKFTQP